MNPQNEAPKLSPWPFLAGDAALLGTAYLIASMSSDPLQGLPLIAVVTCVGLGAALAVIPFLLNYTRRQELALAERQSEIAALAQTTAASAEQLGIAAASLHSIVDAANKTLRHAENLPQKLQEKINEFKTQLNEVAVTENEALAQEVNTLRASETDRLEAALDHLRKSIAELTRQTTSIEQSSARASTEKALANAQSASLAAIEKTLARALSEIDARLTTVKPTSSPETTTVPEPSAKSTNGTSEPITSPRLTEPAPDMVAASATVIDPAPVAAKPDRKRPPRKAASHDNEYSLVLDLPGATGTDEFAQTAPEETGTASISSDGHTRLLVTAYIGIGNKLFVRGEGPGLSWDKGIPLQFVSIGKWRWETADASAPLKIKLFKNDDTECTSLGTLTLEPGRQQEVSANF